MILNGTILDRLMILLEDLAMVQALIIDALSIVFALLQLFFLRTVLRSEVPNLLLRRPIFVMSRLLNTGGIQR